MGADRERNAGRAVYSALFVLIPTILSEWFSVLTWNVASSTLEWMTMALLVLVFATRWAAAAWYFFLAIRPTPRSGTLLLIIVWNIVIGEQSLQDGLFATIVPPSFTFSIFSGASDWAFFLLTMAGSATFVAVGAYLAERFREANLA